MDHIPTLNKKIQQQLISSAPTTSMQKRCFRCSEVRLSVVGCRCSATHVCTTPALWSLIDCQPADLPSLKVVALGGEPVTKQVVHLWGDHVQLYNTYGVTECTVYQTVGRLRPGACVLARL